MNFDLGIKLDGRALRILAWVAYPWRNDRPATEHFVSKMNELSEGGWIEPTIPKNDDDKWREDEPMWRPTEIGWSLIGMLRSNAAEATVLFAMPDASELEKHDLADEHVRWLTRFDATYAAERQIHEAWQAKAAGVEVVESHQAKCLRLGVEAMRRGEVMVLDDEEGEELLSDSPHDPLRDLCIETMRGKKQLAVNFHNGASKEFIEGMAVAALGLTGNQDAYVVCLNDPEDPDDSGHVVSRDVIPRIILHGIEPTTVDKIVARLHKRAFDANIGFRESRDSMSGRQRVVLEEILADRIPKNRRGGGYAAISVWALFQRGLVRPVWYRTEESELKRMDIAHVRPTPLAHHTIAVYRSET